MDRAIPDAANLTAGASSAQRPPTPITMARGDGIGPEIMEATLRILDAAGAKLAIEEIQIGEAVYQRGVTSGIEPSAWESLRRTRVFLKAPITTPQGGGFKSLNVTTRKSLGLFANVRPCASYNPFIESAHPGMNLVIIRENEEDTYSGIEHQQTAEVVQCLKLVSRPGCERIIRYAFEYARRNGRQRVACFTKDNIMKQTDGLFHRVFDEIALEYPEIVPSHFIVDIGAALLADQPETFDLIVTLNLYGDILSDIAAQIAGSVGMAGSANVGSKAAMFEAIHGSAPGIAGRGVANPSGLLQGAVMMLVHIGQADVAQRVQNAWLRTIEDGVHTADVYEAGVSRIKASTRTFADELIARLGESPRHLPAATYPASGEPSQIAAISAPLRPVKRLVGVDVFVDWDSGGRGPVALGRGLEKIGDERLRLTMICNRGIKVYPDGLPETDCTDHWWCRFMAAEPAEIRHADVVGLLSKIAAAGYDFIKTEHLYSFGGRPGFSPGQGE